MTDRDLANRALAAQGYLASMNESNLWWRAAMHNLMRLDLKTRSETTPALRALAGVASTYVLTSEMTELVQNASEDLAREWTLGDTNPEMLLPYDLPSLTGFVLFDHHVNIVAAMGNDQHVESVLGYLWASDPDTGVAFFPFAGRSYWKAMAEAVDPDGKSKINLGPPPEVLPFDYAGWHFNKPWRVDPDVPMGTGGQMQDQDGVSYRALSPGAAADRIILWSFLRLVNQRIPHVQRAHPDRQVTRKMERDHPGFASHALDDGAVRILTLRRENPANEDEAAEDVVWSHRWLVNPGWQRRRVAARDADGKIIGDVHGTEGEDWLYRRVYVAPFVKGPADKPLLIGDTVRVLKR